MEVNKILRISVGADLSGTSPIHRPSVASPYMQIIM